MNNIEVIPAIIAPTRKDIMKEVSLVSDFVNRVQIDVLDGEFTHSKSWPFTNTITRDEIRVIEKSNIRLVGGGTEYELDLMVSRPEYFIDLFVGIGASAIIVHIDSTDLLSELIEKIKAKNIEVGLALKPSNDLEKVFLHINDINFVQFMGNDKIGYHGVPLDDGVYKKIEELKEKFPNTKIAVDIGVNKNTALTLVEAGVTKLVSGSAIFASGNIKDSIEYFKNL